MKKIIALSLLPAFLSADFGDSFINGAGRGVGNALGNAAGANLMNSRWCHGGIELVLSGGNMSKLKNEQDFFNNFLFKMGLGINGYIGFGTKNVQIGSESALIYLFNKSILFNFGLNFYYRYLDFFVKTSIGVFSLGSSLIPDIGGYYSKLQLGYFFHEAFYAAIAVSYSWYFSSFSEKNDNNEPVDKKGSSVSVFLSIGFVTNYYSENLKSAEEAATYQELAKLRARDQYREEKRLKELQKKQEELQKEKARQEELQKDKEYQEYLKFKKNKTRG